MSDRDTEGRTAENERLRKALEEIRDSGCSMMVNRCADYDDRFRCPSCIAAATLLPASAVVERGQQTKEG